MSELFILQNQDKLFFGKNKEWLDGQEAASLYKTPYKDEAINQMVEISAKDYTQRIKVLTCPQDDKGLPVIEEALLPPPQPRKSRAEAGQNLEEDPQSDLAFETSTETPA